MYGGATRERARLRFFKRLELALYVLPPIAVLSTLWSFRMPGTPTVAILPALVAWPLFSLIWIIQLVFRQRRSLPVLIALLMFAACVVLIIKDVPFRFAMWVSKPALMREVAAVRARPNGNSISGGVYHDQTTHYCGVFPISDCSLAKSWYHVGSDVVVFTFDKGGFTWGARGLYYSDRPLTAAATPASFTPEHISGPWYNWASSGW
jgi:hypothetical protein